MNGKWYRVAGNCFNKTVDYVDNADCLNTPLGTKINSIVKINGELYFTDSSYHVIRKMNKDGKCKTIIGSPDKTDKGAFNGKGLEVATPGVSKMVLHKDGSIIFSDDSIFLRKASLCEGPRVFNNEGACVCEGDLFGDQCQYHVCYGVNGDLANVCGGAGNCTEHDTCVCKNGYLGDSCDSWKCNNVDFSQESVCSGHGSCNGPDQCVCDEGYTGSNCEISICNGKYETGKVCSGHGTCNLPNVCACNSGWYGNDCQVGMCNGIFSNDSSVW